MTSTKHSPAENGLSVCGLKPKRSNRDTVGMATALDEITCVVCLARMRKHRDRAGRIKVDERLAELRRAARPKP